MPDEEKPERPSDKDVKAKQDAEKEAARAEHAARRVGETTK